MRASRYPLSFKLLFVLMVVAIGVTSCSIKRQRSAQLPPTSSSAGTDSGKAPATQAPSIGGGSKTLPPIADKVITLAGSCSQTEEDGFREQATLTVDKNDVQSLNWQLWVGKRGSCSFDFKDFTQVQKSPHIELALKSGGQCRLMIWQTPERITLAHRNCQQKCSPGIYDDAWPVMFNPKNGSCAAIG